MAVIVDIAKEVFLGYAEAILFDDERLHALNNDLSSTKRDSDA